MKTLLATFFIFLSLKGLSQDLIPYKDTINHFAIEMPKGWQYQVSKSSEPGVKLFVSRPKENDAETLTENFNVNIVPFPNSNIESAYIDLKANISQRKGYVLISEGDTIIMGMKYKWLLEKHANSQTAQPMMALVLLGYKVNNGYMVTLATTEDSYFKYETLFKKIAGSFSL